MKNQATAPASRFVLKKQRLVCLSTLANPTAARAGGRTHPTVTITTY
ncbi:hypothetical protein ACAW74_22640 [Fibrella sp. WM1]